MTEEELLALIGPTPLIWPPVHDREMVLFLVRRGLPCLRPGCGCTEWWGE